MSGDPLDSAKAALQSLIHLPIRQMRDHDVPDLSARLDAVTTGGCTNLYSRTTIDGVTVAAREQVILDAYGGIDRMPEQADILLGGRVA